MGISSIPPASGAAEVLPVGATSLILEGYNNDGFFIYGSTLPAGTYCVVLTPSEVSVMGEKTGYIVAKDNYIEMSNVGFDPVYITLTTDETRFSAGGGLKVYTADWGVYYGSGLSSQTLRIVYGDDKLLGTGFTGTTGNIAIISANYGHSWSQDSLSTQALLGSTPLPQTYGPQGFLVVPQAGTTSGAIAYSTNGITWSTASSGNTSNVNSARYANDRYFITFSTTAATAIRHSTNLTSWTTATLGLGVAPVGIGYFAGLYLIGGASGSNIQTSTDAITWTNRAIPIASVNQFLSYPGSTYVIGIINSGASGNQAMRSTDGITWTAFSVTQLAYGAAVGSPVFNQYNCFTTLDKYVLVGSVALTGVGSSEQPMFISTDSLSWIPVNAAQGHAVITGSNSNFVNLSRENAQAAAFNPKTETIYRLLDTDVASALGDVHGVSVPSEIKIYGVNTALNI